MIRYGKEIVYSLPITYISSHSEVFCKRGVFRNFAKFIRKYLCQSLFFNKVVGQTCNTIKSRLQHRCFSVKFAKFLRITFFYRTPPVAGSESFY